jgi:hypothetical protein
MSVRFVVDYSYTTAEGKELSYKSRIPRDNDDTELYLLCVIRHAHDAGVRISSLHVRRFMKRAGKVVLRLEELPMEAKRDLFQSAMAL